MTVTVHSLRTHPLKSGAIRRLDRSPVTPAGLLDDRRWMVVDADGECVTARTDRALFTLDAEPLPGGALRLTSRSGRVVEVCRPPTAPEPAAGPAASPSVEPVPATVHGRPVAPGLTLDEPAQSLVREVLGREDVTILWCTDLTVRRLNPEHSRDGDSTAYADGYPVTLASLASLRELCRLAGTEVSVDRFRPNVVIDGDLAPWAEESWTRVTIGTVSFRVAKGVDRCAMTLIDPESLATGVDPLRTLARHRKRGGRTWFAVHLVPEGSGTLAVGDPVVGA